MDELDRIRPIYTETVKANFRALARGGLSGEHLSFACYADYTVHEYSLGAGPATLTRAYDRMRETWSYDPYALAHGAGEFGDDTLLTRGEYEPEMLYWLSLPKHGARRLKPSSGRQGSRPGAGWRNALTVG